MDAPSTYNWRKHGRLRGAPALAVVVGLQTFMLFGISSGLLGGSQDSEKDGTYFLSQHGELREVPRHIWKWMGLMEVAGFSGIAIAVVGMFTCLVAECRAWQWYRSRPDYSMVLVILMILNAALLLVSHYIGLW